MIKRLTLFLLLVIVSTSFHLCYGDESNYYRDVFVRGSYAYCAASGTGLDILDISDPVNPVIIGNSITADTAAGVYVTGNYAYVADMGGGLRIFAVSDPTSPVFAGSYNTEGQSLRVVVSGNYAYLADAHGGFKILDISNPTSPVLLSTVAQYGFIFDVVVQGNYAYLLNTDDWLDDFLLVMDISDPSAPELTGYLWEDDYPDFYNTRRLSVSGNYAYVTSDTGLHIIDISNPQNPTHRSLYELPVFSGGGLFVDGAFVYVVYTHDYDQSADDFRNYLQVLDAGDPAAPVSAARWDLPENRRPGTVWVQGQYSYITTKNDPDLLVVGVDPAEFPPRLQLDRTHLEFGALPPTAVTGEQAFNISNSGGGTLDWTVSTGGDWLSCSPASGTGSGEVRVSVAASGFNPGTYNGTVAVADTNAVNSPQTVTVTLTVYSAGESSGPFGVFATPTGGSTVRGSVPVTGWVLDDIGVRGVEISREENGALVYIGDASLVEGARPDIEEAYPGYPMNNSAGWGYMMLTNFLPNGGNGTFTLHAVATDLEGNPVTLGTQTITCDNANAVKPFGAIDTPGPGGIASGSSYRNQGWVLTPMPNGIPVDGTTIDVYIDGVFLGHPQYNIYRGDIAGFFPGYTNSGGALAYFDIDTAAYENGIHTIHWTARDDAGNSDGIGSRYFSINNSGSRERGIGNRVRLVGAGFPRPHPAHPAHLEEAEARTIVIKELERVQVSLNPAVSEGYLVVGGQLRMLPIGSFLDRETGIFYWQPGAGFLGTYRFVFFGKDRLGITITKHLSITIGPRA